MSDKESVTFARGGAAKTGKAAAATDLVGAIVSAVTGEEAGWNGTVNGKSGFQKGNQYGRRRGKGKAQTTAATAKPKATTARAATSRSKAPATAKHPAVAKAETTHKTALSQAKAADAAWRKDRSPANLEKSFNASQAAAQAERQLLAARAQHVPGERERQAAALANRPAPKRLEDQARSTGKTTQEAARTKILDIRARSAKEDYDPDKMLAGVDQLAKGASKADLTAAAQDAGIRLEKSATKAQVVDAIKLHLDDSARAAKADREHAATKQVQPAVTPPQAVPAAKQAVPKPQPQPTASAASPAAAKPQATPAQPTAKQAAQANLKAAQQGNQVPTGRPIPTPSPPAAPVAPSTPTAIGDRPQPKPGLVRRFFDAFKGRGPGQPATSSYTATNAADGVRSGKLKFEQASKLIPPDDLDGHHALAVAFLDRNASKTTQLNRALDRNEPEPMHSVLFGRTSYQYSATPEGRAKAEAAFALLSARGPLPLHITQATRNVYLTTGHLQGEAFVTGVGRVDGKLVRGVANGRNVSVFGPHYSEQQHGVLGHELSHNFAKRLYGSMDPPENSDFGLAASSGEPPVRSYGATSPREDFATSFQMYIDDKSYFKTNHPKRFAVIDRLIKEPGYHG